MYLCIGTLLKLIDIFSNGAYTKLEICQELFSFADSDYDKRDASELINCNRNIKKHERNHILSFNLQNDRQYNRLHELLESIANFILRDVIPIDNVGPFIQSLLTIMQSDDRLVNDFGMNPEYTKENVFSNFKEFDATEFLTNILYYCYVLKDNRLGKDTVINCLQKSFIEEQSFAANNIIIKNINGSNRYTYRKNCSDNELPRNLTPNDTVIDCSSRNILYRDDEFNSIISSIKSNEAKNIYLYGMGGCGKTSIARMVYSHLKSNYDCYGWINYSENLKQSMIDSIVLDDYSDETMTECDSKKKWQMLQRKLTDSKQSKLFIIDNVDYIEQIQDPKTDKDLISLSTWDNTTIIITSRIEELTGYTTNRIRINNLGDENNDEKCIDLFYHYNEKIASKRSSNHDVVAKLCALAGYNTMVIELLAKGSYYYGEDLDEFYQELLKNNFSCANDTNVSTDHDFTKIRTAETDSYYDIGNETVATQIYKLFNMKTRSELEQLILWDFHCLKENEKVTRKELKDWMGYEPKGLDRLRDEGWIKFQDGLFFIHPLVSQAISCSHETSKTYWDIKKVMIDDGKCSNEFISAITKNTFFNDSDSFELSLRKLLFVDCLTYHGDYLSPNTWINIADFARRRGNVNLGIYYYKKSHNHYSSLVSINANIDMKQYWKCTYFYGYMLSYTKSGYVEAEILLKKSLEIAEHIIQEKGYTDDNILILATSLDHLGYILSNSLNNDIIRITLADIYLNEAVKLRQMLCSAYPEHYRLMHDYAWSLDNLGAFYTKIDVRNINFDINQESNGITHLTKEEIVRNKSKTEALLKKALKIRMDLSKARGTEDSTEVAWTYFNLAELIYNNLMDEPTNSNNDINKFLNIALRQTQIQNAEMYINKALDIYHRLDKRYPGQHMSSEARTTALYGKLLMLCTDRHAEARTHLDKAILLYKTLDNENSGIYREEVHVLRMIYHHS